MYKYIKELNNSEYLRSVVEEFQVYLDSYGLSRVKSIQSFQKEFMQMWKHYLQEKEPESLALICLSLSGVVNSSGVVEEHSAFWDDLCSAYPQVQDVLTLTLFLVENYGKDDEVPVEEEESTSAWMLDERDMLDNDWGDDNYD